MPVTFDNFEDEMTILSTQAQTVGDVLLMDGGIGIVHTSVTASGQSMAVRTRGKVNGLAKDTLVAITAGQALYWDAANAVFTTRAAGHYAGTAAAAQLIGDTTVSIILNPVAPIGVLATISANSSSFTGNTEAVFSNGTLNLPANLPLRSKIEVEFTIRATGQNSTDTFQGRIRVNGLAGTVVADTTAIQMASGTVAFARYKAVITVIGATGTLEGYGEGGAAASKNGAVTAGTVASVALNAALPIVVTGVFSSASAGNTCLLTDFTIKRVA